MSVHICKNPECNRAFEYCRACVFRPIRYMEAGYCSKSCQEAAKIKEVIHTDVEAVVINEDISTSEEEVAVSSFFSADVTAETNEEITSEEVAVEDNVVEEVATTDEIVIKEDIEITNATTAKPYYNNKKKKNKYHK